MSFGQAIKSGFSNYATFSGRSTRSEFWWFYLFIVIVDIVLNVIDRVAGLTFGTFTMTVNNDVTEYKLFGVLTSIFFLLTVIPLLAVGSRRLHDTGKSGWLQLLWLLAAVPCVGLVVVIILIVFYAKRSDPGDNKYGPPPGTALA